MNIAEISPMPARTNTVQDDDRVIASAVPEEDRLEQTALNQLRVEPASDAPASIPNLRQPFLVCISGSKVGLSFPISTTGPEVMLGRGSDMDVRIEEHGVSRRHARMSFADGRVRLEDVGSRNGTFHNGARITGTIVLSEGDRVQIGDSVLQFELHDELEVSYHTAVRRAVLNATPIRQASSAASPWSPESWRQRQAAQSIEYPDAAALKRVLERLRELPPLVTSWEVNALKSLIGDAQEGKRFLLQGGDCAETIGDCAPRIITNKLKILMQMSLVLIHGLHRPVIRVGRFAGQYAKPRSQPMEERDGVSLPSYFGDLVNRPEFSPDARRPDPDLLLRGYLHAGLTLNFVRALSHGHFRDLRRAEYFDLSFFERSDLPERVKSKYDAMCREITEGIHLLRSVGDRAFEELTRVEFFASHEALNLEYESAQTRRIEDRYFDLTTHLPWIGERTRGLDGAHVELFRGLANPVAVKVGPSMTADELVLLCRTINPENERGKVVLITRMGAERVTKVLPSLIRAVKADAQRVLWVCDPMHGNAIVSRSGMKTRNFEDILREVQLSLSVHQTEGTYFGGVHFELTGEDVTECIGGGLTEEDLDRNYRTACDPRLNYPQSIEMAFCIAQNLSSVRAPLSDAPAPSETLPHVPVLDHPRAPRL